MTVPSPTFLCCWVLLRNLLAISSSISSLILRNTHRHHFWKSELQWDVLIKQLCSFLSPLVCISSGGLFFLILWVVKRKFREFYLIWIFYWARNKLFKKRETPNPKWIKTWFSAVIAQSIKHEWGSTIFKNCDWLLEIYILFRVVALFKFCCM